MPGATGSTTRGGLRPASLTNLANNKVVKFHFNPYEYKINKTNNWNPLRVTGLNQPLVTFEHGGPVSLSLKLHFDNQEAGTDVRAHTSSLWEMMMVDESEKNSLSGKSQPPAVAFSWGALYFKAIILSLSENLTLFSPEGIPLRSEVDISLQEYIALEDLGSEARQQVEAQLQQNRSQQLVQGQRLDNVAAASGNSGGHRAVAAQNNIDNPLRVPAGTTLRT